MNKIKNFKNDEEMIQYAAEGCYYPHHNQREFAMVVVIQRLVLPEGVDDYGPADMARFIRLALIDVASRLRVFENYRDDSKGIEIVLKDAINRQQKLLMRVSDWFKAYYSYVYMDEEVMRLWKEIDDELDKELDDD